MGIRLTGISTPIGGASWEYTNREVKFASRHVDPVKKIKVFISSICGKEKYDEVRRNLKRTIEETQLAYVYTFEDEGPSTLPAGSHYKFALEDSDICIFLIDNADGVTPGVQTEVDTVKKYNIKALFYFCDERSKEKTALEQSLEGANFAKSSTVHRFEDLSEDGACALKNDIIGIYHYYCKGKMILDSGESNYDDFQSLSISDIEKIPQPMVPKVILKHTNRCKKYILKFVLGGSYHEFGNHAENTSEIDEWSVQFLPVLFEARSIKLFNTGMFLDDLKREQTEEYHQVVKIRWLAIQAYFLGDVEECVKNIKAARDVAKELNLPTWVTHDILIDLRNQSTTLDRINNCISESEAQKEITNSKEELYYPLLDRIHNSLHEKYIKGLFEKKIKSPYTVTLGSDLDKYGDLLASSFIIAIYNGSLTHILLFYDKIKKFLFYLSSKYDDWNFQRDLFKMAIYNGVDKEINGIAYSYPAILNNIGPEDAVGIMEFCNNHPVKYMRLNSQLIAFGEVGYYLEDKHFSLYETLLVSEIKNWLNEKNPVLPVGNSIFRCLSGISFRLSQEILAEICCLFIDRQYRYCYMDMFGFIKKHIDLQKMTEESAIALIEKLITILENEKDREQIKNYPIFLCVLRNQNPNLTEEMDQIICKYMPDYYNGVYKLETTETKEIDFPKTIQNYVSSIQVSNDIQGKDGIYYGYGTREIATIRSILLVSEFMFESKIIDSIISTVADTLLKSKEDIRIKLDAISLLICIAVKYPKDFLRNRSIYEMLVDKQDEIDNSHSDFMSSNIDNISLKIGVQFLFTAIGIDTYSKILEIMPYIQNNIATTIYVARIIIEYLEVAEDVVLPNKIESVVLQNVLQWLQSDNIEIRWYACRILLTMIRNSENEGIVNHQLLSIVDSENFKIKNLIMRNIYKTRGMSESTKQYVISKCQNDANFVVRMVCEEERRKQIL